MAGNYYTDSVDLEGWDVGREGPGQELASSPAGTPSIAPPFKRDLTSAAPCLHSNACSLVEILLLCEKQPGKESQLPILGGTLEEIVGVSRHCRSPFCFSLENKHDPKLIRIILALKVWLMSFSYVL